MLAPVHRRRLRWGEPTPAAVGAAPTARRAPVTSDRASGCRRPTLVVLDLVGIFVFAISGALVAVRKDLDVFGVLVLAGTTGLGGGFLRDVLIGATPPAALADWRYLLVPVAAGLLTFWFHPTLGRMERVVNVFDAFGLGAVLRDRRAEGAGVRPRSGAGRADGHGHRDRRRHGPRRAGRPRAGGVPGGALRHPGPGRGRDRRGRADHDLDLVPLGWSRPGGGACLVWRLLAMCAALAGTDAARARQRLSRPPRRQSPRTRRRWALAKTRSGSSRSRSARKSPKRGYTGARSAAVRVCTLPQCGRPSWARRIGSIAAKYAVWSASRWVWKAR